MNIPLQPVKVSDLCRADHGGIAIVIVQLRRLLRRRKYQIPLCNREVQGINQPEIVVFQHTGNDVSHVFAVIGQTIGRQCGIIRRRGYPRLADAGQHNRRIILTHIGRRIHLCVVLIQICYHIRNSGNILPKGVDAGIAKLF